MTKKQRWLEKLSLELLNGKLDDVTYDSLDDCYKTYSNAKRRAENWCKETFNDNTGDLIRQCVKNGIYNRLNGCRHVVLSHNCNFFTYYQAFSFYTINNILVVLYRYDTYANIKEGCFMMDRLSHITRFDSVEALLESLKSINNNK